MTARETEPEEARQEIPASVQIPEGAYCIGQRVGNVSAWVCAPSREEALQLWAALAASWREAAS